MLFFFLGNFPHYLPALAKFAKQIFGIDGSANSSMGLSQLTFPCQYGERDRKGCLYVFVYVCVEGSGDMQLSGMAGEHISASVVH